MAPHRAWPATAVAAVVVYAAMWIGYRQQWEWLDAADSSALRALHDYGAAHPGWVWFWDVFCTVFGPVGFRVLGMLTIVVAAIQRNLRAVLFILLSVELSGVVTQLAKDIANRPRPPDALAVAASTAFPSGHALEVMAGVLALYTVWSPASRRAVWFTVGAVVVVVAIGFGRVALTVHYPSDVLAGWALGYLYYLACALAFRPPPLQRLTPLSAGAGTPATPDSGR
jgi:membrane-associated phospholipid phosphatase